MTHKKSKKGNDVSLDEMKDIRVAEDDTSNANGGACDIRRPTDCD